MSDGFLVLAQAPDGLTCFLVPRVLADGTRNVFLLQRLKDKLGNRSNASARGRVRRDLGPPGRRGGARGAHHHRDGRGDPPRLCPGLGGPDAPGRGPGGAPRHPPRGVRRQARRQAADAQRPGRPGPGVRGGDHPRAAARGRLRRRRRTGAGAACGSRSRPRSTGSPSAVRPGHGRGRRVPGRQRLRGGVGPAPPGPRVTAELDLGGRGQRPGAGRRYGRCDGSPRP